ncbi:MAG: VanZ family protein [Gammaproteobacteria bacterium]|nr:VanZ family protein [Gammaproteobacteria bacterium]MDH5653975.1 VanZ family protein [Gammaproteobacteria bacterium]
MQTNTALRYRKMWLTLGWLLTAFVIFISIIPKPPQIDLGISFGDKVGHFLAYALLMAWFIQLYHTTGTRLKYALGFVAMGVGLEYIQGLGPDRLFEYADMAANTAGVTTMLLLMHTRLNQLFCYVERKLGLNKAD